MVTFDQTANSPIKNTWIVLCFWLKAQINCKYTLITWVTVQAGLRCLLHFPEENTPAGFKWVGWKPNLVIAREEMSEANRCLWSCFSLGGCKSDEMSSSKRERLASTALALHSIINLKSNTGSSSEVENDIQLQNMAAKSRDIKNFDALNIDVFEVFVEYVGRISPVLEQLSVRHWALRFTH